MFPNCTKTNTAGKYCDEHWFYHAGSSARARAKKKNIPVLNPPDLTTFLSSLWDGTCFYCDHNLIRGVSRHIYGAQVGAALKNVIALGVGILDGASLTFLLETLIFVTGVILTILFDGETEVIM